MAVAASGAPASAAPAVTQAAGPVNPVSPAYGHSYRHGVVPTRATAQKMANWALAHPNVPAASANNLTYGGAIDGIGVTTGPQKVYLVFYGSQWGTQGTNSSGYTTLSGDPSGEAPDLQGFFKGLGTGNELWSGVLTQYCDGVTTGAQTCPASNTEHVGYPTGGALAGVWVDESAASPSTATGHQLGVEAVNAAAHFGNTTAAANRDTQYVVISPTGTNPDNWLNQGFCAWHDYNGDSTLSGGAVSSPYGDIAFTNLPYITDAGTSCGQDFVNSNGTLDGVTIVEGHEYAETSTDQNPPGGWTDSSGAENGDKCAWINPGTSGGSFDLSLTTGTYAVQTTWGNDGSGGAGACEGSHAIVTNGGGSGNTVTVANPGNQSGTVGTAVSLQVSATDSASGQTLAYTASGLPAGLSISSSGLISGTPASAATYSVTVTATDTTGAAGTASFTWTVAAGGGGGNVVANGGFETGSLSSWTAAGPAHGVTTSGPHSGSYAALLGSTSPTNGSSTLTQTFTAAGGDSHLSLWYNVTCPDTVTFDWATVTLRDNTSGTTKTVLAKTCVASSGWKQVTATITAGHSYTLTLTSHDDNFSGDPTFTKYDDVATS
jgi:serine protease